MDPVTRMRNRLSQGRRSSVDPTRYSADESCIMATDEKRPRSGIPRIVAPSGYKKRSSSSDRTWSVSKQAHDGTLLSGSVSGILFTPQNPVTPRVSLSARKAIDCISQLSAKSQNARKDQRTALDKNAQLRLSRHVASYLNQTGLVGDLLVGGQGRAPSGPIQSSDLKNMNKGVFITLFNLLYKKLGSRRKVDLCTLNYHEHIPMIVKRLCYPGVIYRSHLLTPSTPHSWPYIIAFLGWLVDLVEFQQPYETALEGVPKTEALAVKDFYMVSFVRFLNEEIQEPHEEDAQEFKRIVCALRGIQPEVMEDLTGRRNKLKALMDDEEQSLNSLIEQVQKEKVEIKEIISQIEEQGAHNENKKSKIEEFMNKISEDEKKKEMLVSKIELLKREKEGLKVICSNQKLSKPEWDQMVAENKRLREGNQMLVEMCEQTKKILDNLDLKISLVRNKLHKVSFDLTEASMSVQADSAQVAQLLKLIQNFNHLASDAQKCFEEILSALYNVLAEITLRVEHDQAKAKALQDGYREVKNEAEKLRKEREELLQELESLRHLHKMTAVNFKEVEDKLEKKNQQVQQQVKLIRESSLCDCNLELEKTKEMYNEKLEELEVKKQLYANLLREMCEMAEEYYKIAMEKMTSFQAEAGELSKEIAKFTNRGN